MSDLNQDPNARYDRVRCRTCGWPWRPYTDAQGRNYAGHPPGKSCSRNRPRLEGDTPEDAVVFGTLIEMASQVNSNGDGHH